MKQHINELCCGYEELGVAMELCNQKLKADSSVSKPTPNIKTRAPVLRCFWYMVLKSLWVNMTFIPRLKASNQISSFFLVAHNLPVNNIPIKVEHYKS